MRFAWYIAIVTCLFPCWIARARTAPAPGAGILTEEGRAYRDVAGWARVAGIQVQPLRADESLKLTGPAGTLVLKADSREAVVDGVQVWLSFPVLLRGGALWVSRSDVKFTLEPLMMRLGKVTSPKIRAVCVDPGHGGKDAGFQAGGRQEKHYTLLLAEEVRKSLAGHGVKVTLTRGKDVFVELPTRAAMAKSRKADLFVSLHFNSAEGANASARGIETFCLTPPGAASTNARGEAGDVRWLSANANNDENLLLAYSVQKALVSRIGVEDRGVRRARFAVLRDATMPAILVEAGFMSHPGESRKIGDPAYRRQLAAAIVAGILDFQKALERRT